MDNQKEATKNDKKDCKCCFKMNTRSNRSLCSIQKKTLKKINIEKIDQIFREEIENLEKELEELLNATCECENN